MARPTFQPPKGTRDFYPAELLVRRYITDAWRRVALRHGFDEIDGPTFETSALYKVKSGDAILGEMFGVFSGKDPDDVAAAGRGDPPFVLRPEFTPTLARMYAAKAAQLPKPTKWFCVPNFFRAERQQRGRLREFMQFNVDALGGDDPMLMDHEVISCAIALLSDCGLSAADVKVKLNNRQALAQLFASRGVPTEKHDSCLKLLDRRGKMPPEHFEKEARELGLFDPVIRQAVIETASVGFEHASTEARHILLEQSGLKSFVDSFVATGTGDWVQVDSGIVRGLAYYTGTVFEVIAEGERAVAGGGRYDNLVELFGGPPTPACGFGMGDVVLGNLLTDKGLMPEGKGLLDAVSRPMPVRPDVFVIASSEEAHAQVTPLVAQLRRGEESPQYKDSLTSDDPAKRMKPWDNARYTVPPLHARRSYKATKNVGKLLADASASHARYAAILESANSVTLKNLETGNQSTLAPNEVGAAIARG